MIPELGGVEVGDRGKPRASGDDPDPELAAEAAVM